MRPAKVTAIGYGATPHQEGYSTGQRRLLAMRASKLDAYRALTEEVYGVRITSNSTVSALVSQQDSFRAYVDAYLRGAKILTVTPLADGNYETVMELEISNQFYDALNQPRLASNMLLSGGCGIKGAVGPGCTYGAGFYHAE
ncbi:MAG: LPP20 family lipoprotein [Sulfurimicrobium sp.]|nr:LPP20 family lipoprotein [Sulfurimicrobium sp.]